MTLDQFLGLLATELAAIGSVYVLIATLRLSPQMTAGLSATHMGHNPHQLHSLSAQKADVSIGAGLIVFALLLVIAAAAIGPTQVVIHKTRLVSILLAVIIVAITFLPLHLLHKALARRHYRATAYIVAYHILDDFLSKPTVRIPIGTVYYVAFDLLMLPRYAKEEVASLLQRLADRCDRPAARFLIVRDDTTPASA